MANASRPSLPLSMMLDSASTHPFMLARCRNKQELSEFLAFVVVFGPMEFPPEMKMSMSDAFENIRDGLGNSAGELGGRGRVVGLTSMLEYARSELEAGRGLRGLHILQDLMHEVTETGS